MIDALTFKNVMLAISLLGMISSGAFLVFFIIIRKHHVLGLVKTDTGSYWVLYNITGLVIVREGHYIDMNGGFVNRAAVCDHVVEQAERDLKRGTVFHTYSVDDLVENNIKTLKAMREAR